jgi:DNA-directed RNA polymerase subunit F
MKEIFYKKVGRRYVPVYEYDQILMDAFPKGSHLVICYPGGKSTRYNVDPAYAPMIAAGRVAEDKISEVLRKASDMRPKNAPLTQEQRDAWEHLVKVMGDDARMLAWPSAREACEVAVKAMQEEADKLLTVPAVKKAYEHFLFLAELTKDRNVQNDLY